MNGCSLLIARHLLKFHKTKIENDSSTDFFVNSNFVMGLIHIDLHTQVQSIGLLNLFIFFSIVYFDGATFATNYFWIWLDFLQIVPIFAKSQSISNIKVTNCPNRQHLWALNECQNSILEMVGRERGREVIVLCKMQI